jgi:manganese/zinc/iron transport system substrate-binding protein
MPNIEVDHDRKLNMKMNLRTWLMGMGAVGAAWLLSGGQVQAADKKLRVVTTVTMVGDLVKQIGGNRVHVQELMGPGVDPHLYKATAADVAKPQGADVIFYSGLMLEGKMQELFDKMSRSRKHIYAATADLPKNQLLQPAEFEGHYDPHVWFEVPLWEQCAATVTKGLIAADPAGKSDYEKRGAELRKKLLELHQWAVKKANELPAEKRILITSHDAYNYFGRAYGFKVVGLQGISTVSEARLADMVKLVDFIKQNKVKAIFVESSVPPNAIQRISKDSGAKIGGELFSDAMGTPGQIEHGYDLGTYEGMIKHNLTTIVEALK